MPTGAWGIGDTRRGPGGDCGQGALEPPGPSGELGPKGNPGAGGAEEGRPPSASLKSVLEAVSSKVSFYKPTPVPNNSILYSRNKNVHL